MLYVPVNNFTAISSTLIVFLVKSARQTSQQGVVFSAPLKNQDVKPVISSEDKDTTQ